MDPLTFQLPNPDLFEVGNTDREKFSILTRFSTTRRKDLLAMIDESVKEYSKEKDKPSNVVLVAEMENGIIAQGRTFHHLFWAYNSK